MFLFSKGHESKNWEEARGHTNSVLTIVLDTYDWYNRVLLIQCQKYLHEMTSSSFKDWRSGDELVFFCDVTRGWCCLASNKFQRENMLTTRSYGYNAKATVHLNCDANTTVITLNEWLPRVLKWTSLLLIQFLKRIQWHFKFQKAIQMELPQMGIGFRLPGRSAI